VALGKPSRKPGQGGVIVVFISEAFIVAGMRQA
jgi:hypothetical protein